MQSFFTRSLLAILAFSAVCVLASPATGECHAEYCPDNFQRRDNTATPSISPRTNAELLARGLPLNPPTRRSGDIARRAAPSSGPQITKRGYIQVTNVADGSSLGYISKNSLSQAQLRYQPSMGDALIVNFKVDQGATSASNINFNTENSDIPNYTFLGFVQGRDDVTSDVASGSYQYLYIGVTNPTAQGSTPQTVGNSYTQVTGLSRTSESSVWSINLSDNTLTLQWVNSDGSKPTTLNFAQSTALYAGGDSGQFNSRYPAPIISVSYKFVSI